MYICIFTTLLNLPYHWGIACLHFQCLGMFITHNNIFEKFMSWIYKCSMTKSCFLAIFSIACHDFQIFLTKTILEYHWYKIGHRLSLSNLNIQAYFIITLCYSYRTRPHFIFRRFCWSKDFYDTNHNLVTDYQQLVLLIKM